MRINIYVCNYLHTQAKYFTTTKNRLYWDIIIINNKTISRVLWINSVWVNVWLFRSKNIVCWSHSGLLLLFEFLNYCHAQKIVGDRILMAVNKRIKNFIISYLHFWTTSTDSRVIKLFHFTRWPGLWTRL